MGIGQGQLVERLGLGGSQKRKELMHIQRMGAVKVFGVACQITRAAKRGDQARDNIGSRRRPRADGGRRQQTVGASHVPHDQGFKPFF